MYSRQPLFRGEAAFRYPIPKADGLLRRLGQSMRLTRAQPRQNGPDILPRDAKYVLSLPHNQLAGRKDTTSSLHASDIPF